ncbi:GspH/FimT family pseudopilin [Methylobacterium oxalidis]|uniref:GspH/FimT family pseudopilin n=1 Tax=Methylobacterium oxalidis TaxID=944322 RepID=UPI00331460ED
MRPGAASEREAGFSLVEMLVVLAVLALAAAIGIPSIGAALPGRRLDGAVDALAGELGLLRAEALRTGRRTRIVFDERSNSFLSSRRGTPSLPMPSLRVAVEADPLSRAGPGEIRFLPGGTSTDGRILLAGAAGTRRIAVSRVTGAVRRAEEAP